MAEYSAFRSVTGTELEKACWPAQGQPKAVVQLVHGMAEHIRRYDETARQLSAAGFAVVGHTHLGHGEKAEQLGWFAPHGGWDALVEDVHALRLQTQQQFPELPYFLLGHSMGSFVVRSYCLKHEQGLAGVILSGTGRYSRALVSVSAAAASLQCAFGMARRPGRLIRSISFAGYLKHYEDVRTANDWLSRDRSVVSAYNADPLCGFSFTVGAYRDLFDGFSRLYPDRIGAMRREVPLYLFSGDMDPVGAYGKGVESTAQELRRAGVEDVTVRLYPGGRHEMLNELNREQVWQDLIAWLNSQCASA